MRQLTQAVPLSLSVVVFAKTLLLQIACLRRKHNLVDRQLNVLDLAVDERDFVSKTVVGNNLSACHSMSVVDMTRPGIRQQV